MIVEFNNKNVESLPGKIAAFIVGILIIGWTFIALALVFVAVAAILLAPFIGLFVLIQHIVK